MAFPNASNPNTILLKGKHHQRYEERKAATADVYPGMLVEVTSGDSVQPHSTRGGRGLRAVALESYFSGGGYPGASYVGGLITDPYKYTTTDLVRYHICQPTDEIYALLHLGENVVEGDWLISYGDGTWAKAASTLIANVVADSVPPGASGNTITAFSNGTVTIPKNTLKVGDTIRIRAQGDFPATHSTDTAIITLKIGTTVIVATAALDVANGDAFLIDATLVIRTIGATGTVVGYATSNVGTPGTTTTRAWELASTTIDTTADQSVTANFTWSVSDAGNQAVLHVLQVEQVKAGLNAGAGLGEIMGQAMEALDLSISATNGFLRVQAK